MSSKPDQDWSLTVTSKRKWLDLDLKELWHYRDLVMLLFRRDLVTHYKQTILGPLWYVIQPLLTTIIFTVVFGNIGNISTDGQPHTLFYLSGIVIWNYFAECFKLISETFVANKKIYGKVYFPRVVMPISTIVSSLVKFGIQFLLFMGFIFYFALFADYQLHWDLTLLLLPLMVLLAAGLSLGFGMITSSMTTKYRDLSFMISFGIQLLMYATPVIYPLSEAPEKYRVFLLINPMSSVIETFRYVLLKSGNLDFGNLLYSGIFTVVILVAGFVVFNKTEKSFIDTV
jgi:lipopolysaccharide transport system permease protein